MTAMFGQTVLAELPSSLRQLAPNETRSVEACFIHSGLNTGPVVQGVFRVDGEQVLKRFVARNLRPIFPVAWNHVLAADVLKRFENQSVEDLDARPEIMQPNHLRNWFERWRSQMTHWLYQGLSWNVQLRPPDLPVVWSLLVKDLSLSLVQHLAPVAQLL